MSDSDQSLGDEKTFGDQLPARSGPSSLGNEVTMGGLSGAEDTLLDQDMELVDLSKRYTIEGALGKGGMGEVLLATDTRLKRKVAISGRPLAVRSKMKSQLQTSLMPSA